MDKKKAKAIERAREKAEYEKKRQKLIAETDPAVMAEIEKEIQAMERYLVHLLSDLKDAASNLPDVYPYHIDYPMEKGQEWIPELAKTPYKRIADWTGIPPEALPREDQLTVDQLEKLVAGIEELWDAYYFMFDMADELDDPVVQYRMYQDCWEDAVQYLPNLGFEVELCNGDPEGCRMGDDCICLYDPPDLSWDEPPIRADDDDDMELPF